jgi:hypothetical protein
MKVLHAESDEMVGDAIAAAGIAKLKEINRKNEALIQLSGTAAD